MAIDTPARLAILGASPLGLEAALYARFLGYDVAILEQATTASGTQRRAHVRMFTPFARNHSPLGLAAIRAQQDSYRSPADDEYLTYGQWFDRYLAPLAATDLLEDHIHERTKVIAIGRAGLLKGELPHDESGDVTRGDYSFRILLRDDSGRERIEEFDGVLDYTGMHSYPNYLGESGIPAVGELDARSKLDAPLTYDIPDILGTARPRHAGRHTMVVGAGDSAATTLQYLAQLALSVPATRITWVTRHVPESGDSPISRLDHDPLPPRDQLRASLASLLAPQGPIQHAPGSAVTELERTSSGWLVHLVGVHAGSVACDEIIANVGYQPSFDWTRELHLDIDSLTRVARTGTDGLTSGEPHYYSLGSKSRARADVEFGFDEGLRQIREVFAILGDRPLLNLYASRVELSG